MRKLVMAALVSAGFVAVLAKPASVLGAPGYSWHQCPYNTYGRGVIYMKVHGISCTYGGYVTDKGFQRRWVTRVGHFRCTPVRNALNVVCVNICYRHHRRQGLFFDTK
jgi:hypothetical protein